MHLNSLQVEDKLPQAGFELWPISSGPLDSVKLHVGNPLSFWAMLIHAAFSSEMVCTEQMYRAAQFEANAAAKLHGWV